MENWHIEREIQWMENFGDRQVCSNLFQSLFLHDRILSLFCCLKAHLCSFEHPNQPLQ